MKVEYAGPDTGGATRLLSGMHYKHTEVRPLPLSPPPSLPPQTLESFVCIHEQRLERTLVEHAPHSIYVAEAWDASTNTLRDLSGDGRHAVRTVVPSTGRQRQG